MRMTPPGSRAYTYKVTEGPDGFPVSLDLVKQYLKITTDTENDLLDIFIGAATSYAEGFTRRDFITRTYETFRDFFSDYISEGYYSYGGIPSLGSVTSTGYGNIGFELRRSVLQSVESIEYLSGGVVTLVPTSTYYNTIETDYSEVLTVNGADWPEDADRRLQAITITFKTGFGDTDSDMPAWVTEGILQHVANMWANRGDCSACGDTTGSLLPLTAKALYLQNRILNL